MHNPRSSEEENMQIQMKKRDAANTNRAMQVGKNSAQGINIILRYHEDDVVCRIINMLIMVYD